MRTKHRVVGPTNPLTPKPPPPPQWATLMAQVLDRAKRVGHNTNYLEEAVRNGKSEQVLRRMGIISPTDIDREFPLK